MKALSFSAVISSCCLLSGFATQTLDISLVTYTCQWRSWSLDLTSSSFFMNYSWPFVYTRERETGTKYGKSILKKKKKEKH